MPDCWAGLNALTPARLALGRVGVSLPTAQVLRFGSDHALARDAVHQRLDIDALEGAVRSCGFATLRVASRAGDRSTYLMRPDLGRRLDPSSVASLRAAGAHPCDLLLVVGDGLSCPAVARHAAALLGQIHKRLAPAWRVGPVVLAQQARVALADEIGQLLGARMVAILIGERPGLSSPDSLGIYITWAPQVGRNDAQRNCISNIRPQGLGYEDAARRMIWLCQAAHRLQLTGVALKDDSDPGLIDL